MEKILVLGVGNILYMDEGIGVKCLDLLRERHHFPDNVTLMDGGTLGLGLMKDLLDHNRVFILDAVLGNGQPGDLYRLTGEDLRKSLSFCDSMHGTDLLDTLIICDLVSQRPEVVVIGMEPFDYRSLGLDLSEVARVGLPKMAKALINELISIGIAPLIN